MRKVTIVGAPTTLAPVFSSSLFVASILPPVAISHQQLRLYLYVLICLLCNVEGVSAVF